MSEKPKALQAETQMASSAAFILYFMGSLLNKMQKYLDVRVLVYYEGVNLFCQGAGKPRRAYP